MPKTIKTEVYLYSELKDECAKSQARDWFIQSLDNSYISDHIVDEDAKSVYLEIPEWDLYRRTVKAKFMVDADTTALAICQEHGETCETYKTAMDYLFRCYKVFKNCEIEPIDEESQYNYDAYFETAYKDLEAQFLSDIAYDYLHMLEQKWEYMQSEEYLADTFEANGYTFTAEGKRFG
jgi:hypothetical protein